jgi:hypothetical protein
MGPCLSICACTPNFPSLTAPTASMMSWPRGRRWPARAGHHRPEQPVRGHQVLQGGARQGGQAAHRRRGAVRRPGQGCHGSFAPGAAGAEPPGLPQPVRAAGPGLHPQCGAQASHWQAGVAEELSEGLIACRARRPGRSGRPWCRATARAHEVALQLAGVLPAPFLPRAAARRPARRRAPCGRRRATGGALMGLPVVATHPVQFTGAGRLRGARGAGLYCRWRNAGQPRRVRRFTREQYFKSAAQMEALFADIPSALANTVEIAKRCNLTLVLGKPQLPDFPTPLVDGGRCRWTILPPRVARGPEGAAGAPVPGRGAARAGKRPAMWSAWSSR